VSHAAGYNYGLPRQRSSPRPHDTASGSPAHASHERIRVCVRKRPRTATELKQNDADVITVSSPGRVVVNALKSALDLSKFLLKVFMYYLRVAAMLLPTELVYPVSTPTEAGASLVSTRGTQAVTASFTVVSL